MCFYPFANVSVYLVWVPLRAVENLLLGVKVGFLMVEYGFGVLEILVRGWGSSCQSWDWCNFFVLAVWDMLFWSIQYMV